MERIIFKSAKVKEVEQAYEGYVNWCDDVVVSVKFQIEGQKDMWLSIYQKDNMPGFYLSDEDIFDRLLHVRQFPELMRFRILYFAGFKVDWYESIYPALNRHMDSPYSKIIRLACFMAREDIKDVTAFVKVNKSKYIDAINIPTTDFEEMYLKGKCEALDMCEVS